MRIANVSRHARTAALAIPLFFLACGAFGATITVTSAADNTTVDTFVTLREAIISINNGANLNSDVVAVGAYGTNDRINFNIGTGVQTIAPAGSQLPTLTKPVIIDGTTQPGFAGTPLIVLDGVSAGSFSRGLTISGGNSTIRGLVLVRFFFAIEFNTSGSNLFAGNYVGINAAGTTASANSNGILISTPSSNNTIGGTTAADRNVISGNTGNGIWLSGGGASGTIIRGNYLGTNAAGTAAVGNGEAIFDEGSNTTIGGTTGTTPGGPCTGACNLISGNNASVELQLTATGSQVLGNLIGTNAAGTGALGNVNQGVVVSGPNVVIGGLTASARNVIAFNGSAGVEILDVTGNPILGNSIFSNGGLGIDLSPSGKTANDACDTDTGANDLQNFPVITSASIAAGNVTISGTLNSTLSSFFRVEFFSSASCDPSGNGEGQTFLGFATVPTAADCNGSFGPLVFPIPAGQSVITSTATLLVAPNGARSPGVLRARPAGVIPSVPFETSEFSACFIVQGQPTNTPTATPTATPTSTPTNTPAGVATSTPTNTPTGTQVTAVVPTLSFPMLGLLALALAAAALFLFRRS